MMGVAASRFSGLSAGIRRQLDRSAAAAGASRRSNQRFRLRAGRYDWRFRGRSILSASGLRSPRAWLALLGPEGGARGISNSAQALEFTGGIEPVRSDLDASEKVAGTEEFPVR